MGSKDDDEDPQEKELAEKAQQAEKDLRESGKAGIENRQKAGRKFLKAQRDLKNYRRGKKG
jgi:hypothetical protein